MRKHSLIILIAHITLVFVVISAQEVNAESIRERLKKARMEEEKAKERTAAVGTKPVINNKNDSLQKVNQNSRDYPLSESQKKDLRKEADQRFAELENIAQQESPKSIEEANQHFDKVFKQIDQATEGKTAAELLEMSDMVEKKRHEIQKEKQELLEKMEQELFEGLQENNKE